ncbi:hypothetical protein DITRI_Ditri04bG0093900 [Diplodiscus trichospermus]
MADIVGKTSGKHKKKMEITFKTIGPALVLLVLMSLLQSEFLDLRKLIARKNHLTVGNLKLTLQGKALHDREDEDGIYIQLSDYDSLIVAVKPKAPIGLNINDDDDDDEDLE